MPSFIRNFPLSIKYTKAIVRLLERECEEAMDDSLAAFIIDFHTSLRAREAKSGGDDRAYYSYLVPNPGFTDTSAFSIVPLRCVRDNNLVGLKVWDGG